MRSHELVIYYKLGIFVFSKGFPSLTPNLYKACNTTAVLSRHNAISQQLRSGAIPLPSAAPLRFMLLLEQNRAQCLERGQAVPALSGSGNADYGHFGEK